MGNLLRSELFRVRKRFQSWMMLAISLVSATALYAILVIISLFRSDPDSVNRNIQLPKIYDTGLIVVNISASIMVTVFAASLMGNEYSWNTLRPLLARSKSRAALLTAKWVTTFLYGLALTVISVIAVHAFSIIGSAIVGVDTGFSGGAIVDGIEVAGRYALGILPYAALGMFMAVLTRSNTAGIALGLALQLLEPAIFAALSALSDIFDSAQKVGLAWNSLQLTEFGEAGSDVTAGQAFTSGLVLLAWIAAFVLISYRVFTRRDVTSG